MGFEGEGAVSTRDDDISWRGGTETDERQRRMMMMVFWDASKMPSFISKKERVAHWVGSGEGAG